MWNVLTKFQLIRDNQLFLKMSKIDFGCLEVKYLSHIVSQKCV